MTDIAPLIAFLIVIALLAFLSFRAATGKRRIAYADHYHWIFRSLAALVAVSALIATAIGTWRGSGIDKGFHPVFATIPSLPPRPLLEIKNGRTVNLGSAKLIGTVIVARWENGLLIPVAGKSGVCDLRSTQPWRLAIYGSWQSSHYEVVTDINRFVQQGANLQPVGSLTFKTHGPGWSSNRGGGLPMIGTLNMEEIGTGGSFHHAPLSLVPDDGGGKLCLLFHLDHTDADDPLIEIPVADWLARQSTANLQPPLSESYRAIGQDRGTPPGIRMFAYTGPSAFLLLLAAVCGSMCFRYGRRGPAFAGLTFALVLYVGLLDAVVLHRRAGVMADSAKPETVRITAMSAMTGTFFHAKRAGTLIERLLRDPKTPDSLRKIATRRLTDQ
jgi:hypothetical protein